MALGALVDAGLDLEQLRAELQKLNMPDWEIEAERQVRNGIAGIKFHVRTQPQTEHRHLSDIQVILDRSTLDDDVRTRALAVFTRLAEAEATVHGSTRDHVHFHEVGALDAIIDIVGVVIGLKLLGVDTVYASALPLGSGWIDIAHGRIPVPAPAVLELLAAVQAPLEADTTPFELVTPTGAALLAEFATFQRPSLRIVKTGYGFGTRDTGRLNAVRLWLGEAGTDAPRATEASAGPATEQVLLLQTNIDDQSGAQLAYVADQALAAGALDVWWEAIGMKKARPAVLLSVLVRPEQGSHFADLLFRETTSLGIRRQLLDRWTCEREMHTINTRWGEIRVKGKSWNGVFQGVAPEFEDCAQVARTHNVPLQTVYQTVQQLAGVPEAES